MFSGVEHMRRSRSNSTIWRRVDASRARYSDIANGRSSRSRTLVSPFGIRVGDRHNSSWPKTKRLVYDVVKRLPSNPKVKILEEATDETFGRVLNVAGHVWRNDRVRQLPKWVRRRERLFLKHVESGPGDSLLRQSLEQRRLVDE